METTETKRLHINPNKYMRVPSDGNNQDKNDLPKTSSLSECLNYIDKIYKKNLLIKQNELIECLTKIENKTSQINDDYVIVNEKTAILNFINRLYDCNTNISTDNDYKLSIHLLPLKNFMFNECTNEIILEYDRKNFINLNNLLLFNQNLLNYEKILFIFYQLLHVIKEINELDLNLNLNLGLNNLYLDENYFLRIQFDFKDLLKFYEYDQCVDEDDLTNLHQSQISSTHVNLNKHELKFSLEQLYNSYRHLSLNDLSKVTLDWCLNKLSNFNYLLILNCISGRELNKPVNHPCFPWITDFKASLRDLSLTKFRLNKGDQHLDYVYQATCAYNETSSGSSATSGYHITEFQSEITYYVYKSRCTDKTLLCKYVRSKWVPLEYPSSLERLYEWTPEECIPEFYYDLNVFKSIHDDMADLELPDWCAGSCEEFLRIHRNLLESSYVTNYLHNWIDLIFGYKLTGDAAIEAKNICLQLIKDNENNGKFKSHGIVQLFKKPHPKRIDFTTSPRMATTPNTKTFKSINKRTLTLKKQPTIQQPQPQPQNEVQLDDSYAGNPYKILEDVENMLKFIHTNYHKIPKLDQTNTQTIDSYQNYQQNNIKSAVLIFAELLLFDKIKHIPDNTDFNERVCIILSNLQHLPRSFQIFIINSVQNIDLNVDILLNKHLTSIFNFTYFNDLYKLFEYIYKINYVIENFFSLKSINLSVLNLHEKINRCLRININGDYSNEYLNLLDLLNEQKFYITKSLLPHLLVNMNNYKNVYLKKGNFFELLMPMLVKNLFQNSIVCLNSILYLFDKFAKFLCISELNRNFLNVLLDLFGFIDLTNGGDGCSNNKICRLYDFKFVKNLKIFFGLNLFLTYIAPYLVEAISGIKDFHVDEKEVKKKMGGGVLKKDESVDAESSSSKQQSSSKSAYSNDIFQMESGQFNVDDNVIMQQQHLQRNIDFDLNEEDDSDDGDVGIDRDLYDTNISSGRISVGVITSGGTDDETFYSTKKTNFKKLVNENVEYYSFNSDCLSIMTTISNNTIENDDDGEKFINISNTAKNTFQKLIPQLGPVLTCKYFCNDLLKMLTICYMNKKALNLNETQNELNSLKSIDGDTYAVNLLDCLKYVVYLYGEQIILLQYFTYVTNTIQVAANLKDEQRLSVRLEASIISACVLIYYFCSYLDMKLLHDNIKLILNQILLPIIKFISNYKIKFPNVYKSRNIICFKLLDIILVLTLRLGRDYTKIEMENLLVNFFDLFIEPQQQQQQQQHQEAKGRKSDQKLPTKPVNIKTIKNKNSLLNLKRNSLVTPSTGTASTITVTPSLKQRSYNESIIELDERRFKDSILNVSDTIEPTSLKSFSMQSDSAKYRSQSILLNLNLNDENDDDDEDDDEDEDDVGESEKKNVNSEQTINNDEHKNTFTPELAYQAYFNISRHTSGIYVDSILKNGDLIAKLCDEHENYLNLNKQKILINKQRIVKTSQMATSVQRTPVHTPKKSINSSSYGSSFSENISVVGSQIQINPIVQQQQHHQQLQLQPQTTFDYSLKFNEEDLQRFKMNKIDTTLHLTDNWLAYWEHEIRQNNAQFDFKHINLTSLVGHTNTVKCLTYMFDNETVLLSSSKDRTVKLWSLKNFKTITPQWSYNQHKRGVFNVLFMNNLRQCVSCDGQIHTWDPFYGKKLCQYDWQTQIQCQTSIDNQICFGTQDNLIKFIDLRTKTFAYEFRTCTGTSSTIKFLTTNDENNLLVGFTNGVMCLLDIRSGLLQESFKIHESEILQLKFFNRDRFVCTYFDGSMALCSSQSNLKLKLLNLLKVYSDPVTCVSINDCGQMISGTVSNKIGIHSNIDKLNQITYSSSKLLPDNFKSSLSAFTYLPMNRLLCLGADSGDIKLFC